MSGDFEWITREIMLEIGLSIDKHGPQDDVPLGTGPHLAMAGVAVSRFRDLVRDEVDRKSAEGTVTWAQILHEEVLEAFSEDAPGALRAELLQVAAVAVKMIHAIDKGAKA